MDLESTIASQYHGILFIVPELQRVHGLGAGSGFQTKTVPKSRILNNSDFKEQISTQALGSPQIQN
jgi:hypothetical protein